MTDATGDLRREGTGIDRSWTSSAAASQPPGRCSTSISTTAAGEAIAWLHRHGEVVETRR